MKQSARRLRPLLLLSGAALALLALLLWAGGGEQHEARANPQLTVGIDLNANSPSTYESCWAISGPGIPFDVDVFVNDVVDLMAFSADVEYDSSVITITGVETEDTNLFLGSQPNSDVLDASGPIPPIPAGKYTTGAVDTNQVGADGDGVLARLTLVGLANGLSPFNIDMTDIDIPPDGLPDRGVILRDVNDFYLGDTNPPLTVTVSSTGRSSTRRPPYQ